MGGKKNVSNETTARYNFLAEKIVYRSKTIALALYEKVFTVKKTTARRRKTDGKLKTFRTVDEKDDGPPKNTDRCYCVIPQRSKSRMLYDEIR